MHLIPAVAAVFAVLQLQSAALTGTVVDPTGSVVPGATVHVSGSERSTTVVSDGTGRFRIDGLAAGAYLVTVSLAGFRTQITTVRVDSPAAPELLVKLTPGVLWEVLWAVPEPADAYRTAAAIAHVRIDATRPYGPCRDARVVTSHHAASVLRVFKGTVSSTIQLEQEAAGRCSELGRWHDGIERPYRAGEEYVVFLTERPGGFGRLAGPSLAFPVRGGLVDLGGFAGVQGRITVNELGQLLNRLSRNEARYHAMKDFLTHSAPTTPRSLASRDRRAQRPSPQLTTRQPRTRVDREFPLVAGPGDPDRRSAIATVARC